MSTGQRGFWDVEERLNALTEQGDPLEKIAATVDFELLRADLVKALAQPDRSTGSRPPFDPVLKFRMLVVQAMHGLSLAQTEYLVKDRLSWMRFCGLGPGDGVPDANTLWDFREALIAAGALCGRLDRRHGIIRRQRVIDAAAHDGTQLREGLIDPNNTAAPVWAVSARSAGSIGKSPAARRCRSTTPEPTPRSRRYGLGSSTALAIRKPRWVSWCAPSAGCAPRPASRSPTWPTT